MTLDQIEAELSSRIRTQLQFAETGGTMSRKKHGARAQALSEFLGWVRKGRA